MKNSDNEINLLDELNKGVSMGMDAIHYVLDKAEDKNLKKELEHQYKEYESISNKICKLYSKFSEKDIDIINDGTEIDDFKLIYEMEFYFENVKYDYAVNLLTNEIVNYDQEGQNNTNNQSNNNQNNNNQTTNTNQTDTNTTNTITSEEAKTIALEDAKVPSESVNNVIIEQDYNNGLLEYEIEFSFDQIRYEYTIDANGNIVSFDKEQIRS